jgi:hypothetical protein
METDMGVSESQSKRRAGVILNYSLLFLTLLLSLGGQLFGWTIGVKIGFWLAVVLVLITFVSVHLRTGLWRLAHTKVRRLDERELHQTLESLRHAYVVFTIVSLLVVLGFVVTGLGDQTQQLVMFWILLYLAHTLPSSVLAWTMPRVPAQAGE